MYMVTKGRSHWFATIPACFMTAVVTTYILIAPEGFQLSQTISYTMGILSMIATLSVFLYVAKQKKLVLKEVRVRVK